MRAQWRQVMDQSFVLLPSLMQRRDVDARKQYVSQHPQVVRRDALAKVQAEKGVVERSRGARQHCAPLSTGDARESVAIAGGGRLSKHGGCIDMA